MTPSIWDRRLAGRAAGLAGIACLTALLVIVTTDDGAPWARRLAMWGAVAPIASALGTLGAVRLAGARGELRALEALGAGPSRVRLGAVVGGMILALAGPCLAASRWADRSALFPRPLEPRVWTVEAAIDGDGGEGGSRSTRGGSAGRALSLREATTGVRIQPGARITFLEGAAQAGSGREPEGALLRDVSASTQPSSSAHEGRAALAREGEEAAAIGALTLAAIACPAWIALRTSTPRKVVVALAAIVTLLATFQLVAASRGSPRILLAAPLLLLADAVLARDRRSPSSCTPTK